MSTSDDTNDLSNLDSPQSFKESPYSSPSQQVPQLANFLTELSCAENNYANDNGHKPYLRIVEQPQDHFRFRYKSEMVGTHGCLLGKSYATNKTKTHPTVELVNYTGRALIRCRLAQYNKPDEHPHKLLEDEQEDRDVSTEVPEHGSYKVGFAGMGIIHTAKKDVPALLFKKYTESMKNSSYNTKELRMHFDNVAKAINLNIVRLRFSAHDILTDAEICPPVFSEPIHNMKSAATNDLRICRISRCFGRPGGGDDVFILVEKVNKKNVEIRFYEVSENGDEVWSAKGNFLQSDVHHQYAIVFRTPPYRDREIPNDVKVYIELVRPSDGRNSEPKEFTYKANPFSKNKKRKANSSYSSIESSSGSGGSIKSISELPMPVAMANNNLNNNEDDKMNEVTMFTTPMIPSVPQPMSDNDLGSALYSHHANDMYPVKSPLYAAVGPMLGQPNVPAAPSHHNSQFLNSDDFNRLLNDNLLSEEKRQFLQADLTEYLHSYEDEDMQDMPMNITNVLKMTLTPDSGRARGVVASKSSAHEQSPSKKQMLHEHDKGNVLDKNKGNSTYSAYYSAQDGEEVKTLVKELCDIMRNKTAFKKQVVKTKLERLFMMRLSNGDTFLHMTLFNNQASMEYIVKIIHSMRMTHLLNLRNNDSHTILHLAITNDMPRLVPFLISKGCNPLIDDQDGNNAVHIAVTCQYCLEPLLDSIKKNGVYCDLNAYNNEKFTALHLSSLHQSSTSARLLLQHGASQLARDSDGRLPLHHAAYDDCLPVMRELLEYIDPSEIDAVDGRGNTALQIVCGGELRNNTLEIVRLLLEKKADPLKEEDHNDSAWKLARDKPQIREVMKPYIPAYMDFKDEVKSEPEDDFESADEGETLIVGLVESSSYAGELSAALDLSGAWRDLAQRLGHHSLLDWYQKTPSPTRTLINQIKMSENVTSQSLADTLKDMKQIDASNIIRRHCGLELVD